MRRGASSGQGNLPTHSHSKHHWGAELSLHTESVSGFRAVSAVSAALNEFVDEATVQRTGSSRSVGIRERLLRTKLSRPRTRSMPADIAEKKSSSPLERLANPSSAAFHDSLYPPCARRASGLIFSHPVETSSTRVPVPSARNDTSTVCASLSARDE